MLTAYLTIANMETQYSGLFSVLFKFSTSQGNLFEKVVQNNILPQQTMTFLAEYDKSCFEEDPSVLVDVFSPTKKVCELVTKYMNKVRQDCHDETKYRLDTVYEKVEKTKTICDGEQINVCANLNCDDKKECTVDSCTNLGCVNTIKENGSPCATGTCLNGECISEEYTCTYSNCEIQSKTECNGTTKITNNYYCETNICKQKTDTENNSAYCGYAVPETKTNYEKLQTIILNFNELNSLPDGTSVSIYIFDEGETYVLYKQNGKINIQRNGSADIEVSISQLIFDYLSNSTNVCQTLRELTAAGSISKNDMVLNIGFLDTLKYSSLLTCFG